MYNEELKKMDTLFQEIKNKGYNKSPTKSGSVSKTFKSLFKVTERKVGIRLKKEYTSNYTILFKLNPTYKGLDDMERLKDKIGYYNLKNTRERIIEAFMQTTSSTIVGRFLFKLKVNYEKKRVVILVSDKNYVLKDKKSGWDFQAILKMYLRKEKYLMLIKYWETIKDGVKYYKFYDYVIWRLKPFEEFLKLIDEGIIKVFFVPKIYIKNNKKMIVYEGVFEVQEIDLEKIYDKVRLDEVLD